MSSAIATRSAAVHDLSAGVLSTIQGNDRETQNRVFEALTAALPLSDNLKTPFNIVDVVSQMIQPEAAIDPATGEATQDEPYVRITLVGPEGEPSYAASSRGVMNSVTQIFQVYGHPAEWSEPVRVQAVQEGQGTRKFLKLVPAK